MRFLMDEKRKNKNRDLVDIKHDKGGLIDIEFIVQYIISQTLDVSKALREHRNFAF